MTSVDQRLIPPPEIRKICGTLEGAGHETWCVGGAVRDALLGFATLDWDIATAARPEEVQKLFRRTIPVGIKFGTVGILDRAGVLHEVTTFRHDVETDGRHAVVRFGASLEEDLARRDFTINAIAVHAERIEVRDPFGGRADLEKGIIRCVGEPRERLREDRLRALRALRFAGRFDFSIEPATWQAIRDCAPHLGKLSMERVKQELEKVMEQIARPALTLERYREAGIFRVLIPALDDAPRERFAAIDHLARPGLRGRPDRRAQRLGALFAEPGVTPPRYLEKVLKALKYSNVEVREGVTLAEAVARISLTDGAAAGEGSAAAVTPLDPPPSDVALRILVASIGRLTVRGVARVIWARAAAELGASATRDQQRAARLRGIALFRRAIRIAWNDPITIGDLVLDGDDLRTAGVAPGRAMGETLDLLLERVLADPSCNQRERLMQMVKEMISDGPAATRTQ